MSWPSTASPTSSCWRPATSASAVPGATAGRSWPASATTWKIRKDVGEDGLRAIFEISDLGADIIKGRIEKYAIDADFCHGYGYMGFNARQAKTLQAWEKEFRSLGSPHEIRYLHGAEVRQIIGSDAYGSALLHMGGGHVHSLNLLLGEAKALAGLGTRIFEYSPALEVQYGERIRVRTARARSPRTSCSGPATASSTGSNPSCTAPPSIPTRSR